MCSVYIIVCVCVNTRRYSLHKTEKVTGFQMVWGQQQEIGVPVAFGIACLLCAGVAGRHPVMFHSYKHLLDQQSLAKSPPTSNTTLLMLTAVHMLHTVSQTNTTTEPLG